MRRKWVVVGVLGAVLAGASPAYARFLTHSGASGSRTSNVRLAAQLASRVYRARSSAARYRALLDVMRAVHLGVYTGSGKPVVRGAERSWNDVYLYVGEVGGLSRLLGERQYLNAQSFAADLNAVGLRLSGHRFGAASAADAIRRVVRWAIKHPRSPAARIGLLIRDFGLRQKPRHDLAKSSTSGFAVDPLQTEVLTETILRTVLHRSRKVAAGNRLSGACAPPLGNPDGFLPIEGGGDFNFDFVTNPQVAAAAAALQEDFRLDVLGGASGHDTHYGPAGIAPDAGKPLTWQWEAVWTGNSQTISCGVLAGTQLPVPGPAEGVTASITPGGLDKYGQVTQTASDNTGRLTVRFVPNDEVVPGFGQEVTAKGKIAFPEIHLSGALSGLPAPVARDLDTDALATQWASAVQTYNDPWTSWSVTRHAPRGFQFGDVTIDDGAYGGVAGDYETFGGHVCGENPFLPPWDVEWTLADTGGTSSFLLTEPVPGPGVQGTATASDPPIPPDPGAAHYPDMLWYAPRLTFLDPGPTPQMNIERLTDGTLHPDVTVPITEDMSCPAPTP